MSETQSGTPPPRSFAHAGDTPPPPLSPIFNVFFIFISTYI